MKYYISDPHFGHANIIKHCNRPFDSVEAMDETMIRNWNSVVTDKDEVYILGDFCFKNAKRSGADYLKMLNGRKYLIRGNHDNVTREMLDQLVWARDYAVSYDDTGMKIVLSHYPMVEWDGYFRGALHFYGHIHNSVENNAYKIMRGVGGAYNVGVDILDFTPRTLEEVIAYNKQFNDKFREV